MRICEPVTVQQVVGFICDVCKRSFNKNEDDVQMLEVQEFVHIEFRGGYGSVFEDMGSFELDICQHCLKERLGDSIRQTYRFGQEEVEQALLSGGQVISTFDMNQPAGDDDIYPPGQKTAEDLYD